MGFWDDVPNANQEIVEQLGKPAYLNEIFEIHVIPMSDYEVQSPFETDIEGIDAKVEVSLDENYGIVDLRHGDSINIPEMVGDTLTDVFYRVRGIQPDGDGMALILLKRE